MAPRLESAPEVIAAVAAVEARDGAADARQAVGASSRAAAIDGRLVGARRLETRRASRSSRAASARSASHQASRSGEFDMASRHWHQAASYNSEHAHSAAVRPASRSACLAAAHRRRAAAVSQARGSADQPAGHRQTPPTRRRRPATSAPPPAAGRRPKRRSASRSIRRRAVHRVVRRRPRPAVLPLRHQRAVCRDRRATTARCSNSAASSSTTSRRSTCSTSAGTARRRWRSRRADSEGLRVGRVAGYLNPKRGAEPARFRTIIQIVPVAVAGSAPK